MPDIDFDWDGLINLLAKHLYSEKRIFIREIIQNAHDAIIRRRYLQPGFGGQIQIFSDPSRSTISITDDGVGMDNHELEEFLSVVGRGETRTVKDKIEGLIGQFGIGFLSAFVVADKVEVLTQKLGDSSGWLWVNTGSRHFDIFPNTESKTGTKVIVHINQSELGILQEREINDVIHKYADMLLVPIYLNGQSVQINTGRMPWEYTRTDQESTDLASLAYLETRMRDSVLEVIPFNLSTAGRPRAQGLLYISSTRVIALDAPRTVEVFLNRMFVCQNVPEILPQWASFVNGVINSPDLQPTAARDNIVRDNTFNDLRNDLSDVIISHLDRIRQLDPEKFSRILEFHALRIRAACLAYDEFLERFADLIEWKINSNETDQYSFELKPKTVTLPEVLKRLVAPPGQPSRLLCFSSGNADHFFRMANSAGATVLDASDYFEMQLLEVIAKRRPESIRLVRVDREDAEELFTPVTGQNNPVVKLAREMSSVVNPMGSRLDVSARVFEPPSLPSILRNGEGAEERERAQRIFQDPRQSRDARDLAGALLRQQPKALKLTINASNDFVKRLAAMKRHSEDTVQQLMTGLYNSAFLSSGNMTEYNAKVLHADYVRMMDRSLSYLETEAERLSSLQQLEEERRRLAALSGPRPAHKVFFMIAPFSDAFSEIRAVMKELVEERWQCQLFLASDRKYEDRILDSVRTHMHFADAFIAELTDANPNVMFELGAAFADRRDRPIVQLLDGSKMAAPGRPRLPADLQGMIYVDYSKVNGALKDAALTFLEREIKTDVRISGLLNDPTRHRYLSASRLQSIIRTGLVCDASIRQLVDKIPTREAWMKATIGEVGTQLDGSEGDSAELLLQRVSRWLQQNGK